MTVGINSPPTDSQLPVSVDPNGIGMASWPQPWRMWMSAAWRILLSESQSGPTAERPTTLLWPGRRYFDTSLGAKGKPIFVNKTSDGWVLADGTVA